ncbi:MAG: sodium:alanine symporter family protein [Clostridia bacterium]|nr:sodium:alanine symporter family protein [Clostridia bacterium]
MQAIESINKWLNGVVWGIPMMCLILGTGVYLCIRCGFPQFAHFGHIMKNTLGKAFEKSEAKEGSVSPFKAMCTALAASIGTGNIAGVSGAIAIGGPGAVFWMWVSALLGMCTKFAEVTLSIKFRQRNEKGDWVGGPMYYIQNGLGKKWKWLASVFAVFGALAAFGIGNMTQVNTICSTVGGAIKNFVPDVNLTIVAWIVGALCAVLASIVYLGGIEAIGDVCALLVPVMAIIYILASFAVIFMNISAVPEAFGAIFKGAFNPAAVSGGLAGVGIKMAITKGVGRGIFSNEAGLGSASIAHAAADVDHPVKQGMFGVFEVFMDTIVVCTMTAMVVLLGVGVHNIEFGNDIGAQLTINGFMSVFGDKIPGVVVAVCLTMFAFSTVLTWGLYGTRCMEYLFNYKAAKVYQIIFCGVMIIGGVIKLQLAWDIADTLNGLMAIPNLIALLLLSPVVIKLTKEYFRGVKAGKK